VSSVALQLLRAVEEMLIKGATHNLIVRTRAEVALYALNHKRAHLRDLEERFRITITVSADPAVTGQQSYVIDRGEQMHSPEAARNLAAQQPQLAPRGEVEEEQFAEVDESATEEMEGEHRVESIEREGGRRRRRRRGRGGRGRGGEPREVQQVTQETLAEHAVAHEDHDAGSPEEDGFGQSQPRQEGGAFGEGEHREGRRRRRRGRRGGRRNRQRNSGEPAVRSSENGPEPELQHAVEDLDRPSAYDSGPAYSPPIEERPAPPPAELTATTPGADVLLRRSTIREPASFADDPPPAQSPSPATPVVSSTGSDESTATPRRGWWAKRLLGDKG
jgi:ribonuclease E